MKRPSLAELELFEDPLEGVDEEKIEVVLADLDTIEEEYADLPEVAA